MASLSLETPSIQFGLQAPAALDLCDCLRLQLSALTIVCTCNCLHLRLYVQTYVNLCKSDPMQTYASGPAQNLKQGTHEVSSLLTRVLGAQVLGNGLLAGSGPLLEMETREIQQATQASRAGPLDTVSTSGLPGTTIEDYDATIHADLYMHPPLPSEMQWRP
jgi:hypothetical protein